jgi:hypothetical protein
MAAGDVPHLVKHNTLAIWRDGKISGGKREKFVSAWNIARARLVEYGFLVRGSESGKSEDIRLTSKGVAREAFHAREPGGKTKSMLFDQMFRWIEVGEEDKEPGANPQTNSTPNAEKGDVEKAKTDAKVVSPLLDKKKNPTPEPPKSKLGGKFKPVTPFGTKKKPKK